MGGQAGARGRYGSGRRVRRQPHRGEPAGRCGSYRTTRPRAWARRRVYVRRRRRGRCLAERRRRASLLKCA